MTDKTINSRKEWHVLIITSWSQSLITIPSSASIVFFPPLREGVLEMYCVNVPLWGFVWLDFYTTTHTPSHYLPSLTLPSLPHTPFPPSHSLFSSHLHSPFSNFTLSLLSLNINDCPYIHTISLFSFFFSLSEGWIVFLFNLLLFLDCSLAAVNVGLAVPSVTPMFRGVKAGGR